MNSILKQLVSVGILSERVYQMPEDTEDGHTSVDQAKVDPDLPQKVDGDPNPQEEDGDTSDSEDGEPKPELEDDETSTPDAAMIQVDGPRALAALHSALHSTQVLAELVYSAKDSVVAHIGDESAPALHEILFKVKSAHELIAKMMDAANAKPAEQDEPGMGAKDDDVGDEESTETQDEPADDQPAA